MRGWLVFALVLGLSGSASAAPKKPLPPPKEVAQEVVKEEAPPTDARTHFERGQKFFENKKFRDALEEYKDAYQLDPQPAFLYNIAQCYRELGQAEQAKYFYEEFLLTGPEEAYQKKTEGYIDAMDDLITKKRSKSASRSELDVARSHYEKGDAAFTARRYNEAAREFAAAYVTAPSNPLLLNIAQANRLAGNKKEATDYYQRYLIRTEKTADKTELSLREDAKRFLAELGTQPLNIEYPALYIAPPGAYDDSLRAPLRLGRKALFGSAALAVLAGGFVLGQRLYVNRVEGNGDVVVLP